MLTYDQIQLASGVLAILEQEGAVFSPSSSPSRGVCAREAFEELLHIDSRDAWIEVEFRDEVVCFSIMFQMTELADQPADCVERAMMVRRALINMSSN